jgi:hypothetical protein
VGTIQNSFSVFYPTQIISHFHWRLTCIIKLKHTFFSKQNMILCNVFFSISYWSVNSKHPKKGLRIKWWRIIKTCPQKKSLPRIDSCKTNPNYLLLGDCFQNQIILQWNIQFSPKKSQRCEILHPKKMLVWCIIYSHLMTINPFFIRGRLAMAWISIHGI